MKQPFKIVLVCVALMLAFALDLTAANRLHWSVTGAGNGDMSASQLGCIYIGHPKDGTALFDDIRYAVMDAQLQLTKEGGSERNGRMHWKIEATDANGVHCIVEALQNSIGSGPWIVQVRSDDSAMQQRLTQDLAGQWRMSQKNW